MTWKDEDEVVTTYGSLQLGLEQAHAAGVKTEQERIIKLLESQKCSDLDYENGEQCLCGSWTETIALIKGENK